MVARTNGTCGGIVVFSGNGNEVRSRDSSGFTIITYTTTEAGTLRMRAYASAASQGSVVAWIELISLTIPNGSNYE